MMHDLVWALSHSVQLLRGCLVLMAWGLVLLVLSACLVFTWGARRLSADALDAPPTVMVAATALDAYVIAPGDADTNGGGAA